MDERDHTTGTHAIEDSDVADAAARELEAYRREKQDAGRRMAQRARPHRDPDRAEQTGLEPASESRARHDDAP